MEITCFGVNIVILRDRDNSVQSCPARTHPPIFASPLSLISPCVHSHLRHVFVNCYVELNNVKANRSVIVIGGANIRTQIAEVRRGVAVVIATPGRLLDLQERGVDHRRGARVLRRQRLRRGVGDAADLPRGAAQLDLGGIGQRQLPRRAARNGALARVGRSVLRGG